MGIWDLKVGGGLYLSGTEITALPAGLEVGGDLNLSGTKITSLPEDLKVAGVIYVKDPSKIKGLTNLLKKLKKG